MPTCLLLQICLRSVCFVISLAGPVTAACSEGRLAPRPRQVQRHHCGQHQLQVRSEPSRSFTVLTPRRRLHRHHPGPGLLSAAVSTAYGADTQPQVRPGQLICLGEKLLALDVLQQGQPLAPSRCVARSFTSYSTGNHWHYHIL